MVLIIRLSNGMEKCKQGEEELLVKVLSSSSHHPKVSLGQCMQPVLSEQWRCCTMKMEVHKNMHQRRAGSKR